MYNKLQELRARKAEREGGFTLIELLVVVVIIGILIAIAIPLYLNYQKGAHDKAASSDLRAAVSTLQQCYSENANAYPTAGSGVHASTFNLTCGTTTETVNLSSGTSMDYQPATGGVSYQLFAWNSGGHKNAETAGNDYTYDSTVGGAIQ